MGVPAKRSIDTAIRYPNETLQAGRAMFGPNSTSNAPVLARPSPAPSLADRFGNWEAPSSESGVYAPAASSGGLPALIRDEIRRQNQQAIATPQVPTLVDGTQPIPFLPDDGEGSFADRFGDKPPVRRLSSWARPR